MSATPLHKPAPHESGYRHTTGEAIYVDDMTGPEGTLVGQLVVSPIARGRITRRDGRAAADLPGVHAVLFADDIPGVNDASPIHHDEPLLATDEVFCVGQHVALIVAESYELCRQAAALVEVDYEELQPVIGIKVAIDKGDFIGRPHTIKRGDVDAALAESSLRISGELFSGGQDHFYLETHSALAVPLENNTWKVYSSTQHPAEVQAKIAEVMGIYRHQVVVECGRMGGGFGGKETQAAHFASLATLGASVTGRGVKIWLNRDQDMMQTGKRHPWYSRYDAGLDSDGRILALKVETFADGGWSSDLSSAILDRCLFHLDNAYYIPDLHFVGRVARTNTNSNTAFRGFGGPQGMLVVETLLNRAAEQLGIDPAEIRRRNFYGPSPRNRTPYNQEIITEDNRLERIYSELMDSSDYSGRRREIEAFNSDSKWVKRGIGFQPVKFGISFTNAMLNQAGALVHIFTDGSVQLNHGGTEMGQGLYTKMLAVASHELGVPVDRIRHMNTSTDKVPNTSATAASSGSDLNGQAVADACQKLCERLRPIAAKLLDGSDGGVAPGPADIVFEGGRVHLPPSNTATARSVSFDDVVLQAYVDQISMSATGYYATPGIIYDSKTGRGKPFHYYAYGGAVTEVEISGLTGEFRMTRLDILHDVGNSLVPTIDLGQIEGAFIQGYGWLTCEELVWDSEGHLRTYSPDTYKIPAVGEAPEIFNVALLQRADQHDIIHGSKAVGEPPFMLAISAVTALRHAVASFLDEGAEIQLEIPCTPEAVLRACMNSR